jgi:(p)ppGpp synthase/HD superfamily hydrolase
MNTTEPAKLLQTIRSQLSGMAKADARYEDCIKALNFAATAIHTGVRKDGVTPEFYHQLSILGFLITQHHNLFDPRSTYMAAILHDAIEDYPEFSGQIRELFPADFIYAQRLSKMRNGEIVPYKLYFDEMAACPVCSPVKLADRIHNISTMPGVFSASKMRKYIGEVTTWFLPMAKQARRNFPGQSDFYEMAKSVLSMKVASYTYFLDEIDRLRTQIPKRDVSTSVVL